MLLGLFAGFAVGSLVFLFYVCEMDDIVKELWQRRKSIKNMKFFNKIEPHVRRIQKIEEDGKLALKAIQNLHETKKRLNKEIKDYWDDQFRLLLPPPEVPKNREPLTAKKWAEMRAFESPIYSYDQKVGVKIDHYPFRPVPVGALKSEGHWWFAFNNLPGHANKLMFMRVNCFEDVSAKWWFMLPEVTRVPGTENDWTWPETPAKVLSQNLKESVKSLIG